jgi:hypothetical protein
VNILQPGDQYYLEERMYSAPTVSATPFYELSARIVRNGQTIYQGSAWTSDLSQLPSIGPLRT